MAFSGDEENKFPTFLTLNATFSLAFLWREDFGVHWKMNDHVKNP
jgi:hypothetical protein